ncbi:MAG: dTMP kinase [Acidobacteriota bacterium]
MSKRRGIFITFEGPEGAGKSTQLRILADRLRSLGHDVLETQEPGGTPVGKQIRQILLDGRNQELSATAELLLMFASRAQNVDQWILPALSAGKIVLCDRFTDSTLAYQGAARGLGSEVVYELDRIACRGLTPALTLLFDIDPKLGLERARARNSSQVASETRFDDYDLAFHRKVRDAFQQLATDEQTRIAVVDSDRGLEEISGDVWARVTALLERFGHSFAPASNPDC